MLQSRWQVLFLLLLLETAFFLIAMQKIQKKNYMGIRVLFFTNCGLKQHFPKYRRKNSSIERLYLVCIFRHIEWKIPPYILYLVCVSVLLLCCLPHYYSLSYLPCPEAISTRGWNNVVAGVSPPPPPTPTRGGGGV